MFYGKELFMKISVFRSFARLSIVVSVVGATSAIAYNASDFNLADFVAPSVTSTGDVTDPQIGQIVYDSQNDGFYGKAQSGNWVNLNASTLIAQTTFFKDLKSSSTSGGT